MLTLAVIFGTSTILALGFFWLRAAEIRAERRFVLAAARCSADARVEGWARGVGARFLAVEHRLAAWLRATPHRLADLAAFALRIVATRALRMLRWIHERRARGHAPAGDSSKGSVSFFVSALGEARPESTSRGSF